MYVEAEEVDEEEEEGVLHSPYSRVEVPEATSLSQFVLDRAAQHGQKVAFIDAKTKSEMTYEQLVTAVRHVRCGLYKQGVLKGDVVLILLPNCMEYPVIFHSIISLGGVVTTCSPDMPPEEVGKHITASRACHVFTTPELIPVIREATPVDYPMKAFVLGESVGCVAYSSLLEDDASEYPVIFFNVRRDLCLLPYSSGTAGCARPVTLTHHNMVAQLCQLMHPDVEYMSKSDLLVNILSMSHPFVAISTLNMAVISGCTTVLAPPHQTDFFIQTIRKYKPTMFQLIPQLIVAILSQPDAQSLLSSVHTITSTAATLCSLGEVRLRELLPDTACVRQIYGMMECSNTIMAPVGNALVGTIGRILPNIACKVVDLEDGHLCSPGECGELWVRGPQVTLGYLDTDSNSPIPTADHQGWFQTGDIVRYDSAGNFFFVDCVKDIIKYGGLQVPPTELEMVLKRHPCVTEAVVVGVPDPIVGELPKAFVVRTPGHVVTEQELVDFVEGHVAPQKRLRGGVEFINQIPRLDTDKVNRHEFKQLERERQNHRCSGQALEDMGPGSSGEASRLPRIHQRERGREDDKSCMTPSVKRQRTD